MKTVLFCLICFSVLINVSGQSYYRIFLSDKAGAKFDPLKELDPRTLERRIKFNIPLYDSTDFPISPIYYKVLAAKCDSITGYTRWFNAIYARCTNEQVRELKALPFVVNIEPLLCEAVLCGNDFNPDISEGYLKLLKKQTDRLGRQAFDSCGYRGKGIRIAIFDGGFPSVDINPVFDHIRKRNGIIKTWDFARNKEFVYSYNSHGTAVMSCIGGMLGNIPCGLATDAEFLLARTEINREPFSEEKNWLEAVEWADRNGADIINSSLGYTTSRYFPNEMDGKTSLVSKAANMAASKGMLVVNAAGNEGDNKWKKLITPADADSVLTVGGIDPYTDYHISFSSFGPTADKRRKPNVCAFGDVIAAGEEKMISIQGTSFASPLVAGFAACAWQSDRSLSNMVLFRKIEESADLFPYFDYAHGYGVPQAAFFCNKYPSEPHEKTVSIVRNDNSWVIKVNFPEASPKQDIYLYYHIAAPDGTLKKYAVIKVEKENVYYIYDWDVSNGDVIRAHYKGYTTEQTVSN